MKKVGLAYPIFAIYDDLTGSPTYSNGTVMSKAIKYSLKYDKNDARVDADDVADEYDLSVTGVTETLGLNELSLEVQALLLGRQYNDGTLSLGKNDIAPYVGHGLYTKVKINGVYKYAAVWFYKMIYSEPDDEAEAQGEKIKFLMPTIEGKGMFAVNEKLRDIKVFDSAADAKAWLNTLAGIPVSASGGLTALSMTGTGGTLSPSFSASNRYYTFSGLTGTSFTVSATAANHTILLYIDDVLTQTLTSGSASSSIPMTSAGTKKIKIVAFEVGKQSQTTEIIVVKTT